MTTPPDVHTLSGAYAVGAVDADEAAAFEEHLAGCAECREEVRGMQEALVLLADASAVEPPPGLRDRVLAGIAGVPQEAAPPRQDAADPGPSVIRLPEPRRTAPTTRTGRTPWVLAAAAAGVLALGAGSLAWTEHRAADQARTTAESTRADLEQARQQASQAQQNAQQAQQNAQQGLQQYEVQLGVLTNPAATRTTGQVDGGGQIQLVLAGGRAVVVAQQMPALPAGRIYQLWLVGGDGITSAGLGPGGEDAAGRWTRLVEQVRAGQAVALSVEPDGGSQQPTTTPLVAVPA